MTDSDDDPRSPVSAPAPRNAWYAAVASSRLADAPVPVKLLGWNLVLFRDSEGRAHALHDRCIHRGARLRLGEVVGGALACRYHGWRFAGDGRCVHIPSLADGASIPQGARVRAFPCLERDGYAFVWIGDAPPADGPEPIEAFRDFDWIQGSLELGCAALLAIENNLDWCHPVFAHPRTHGMYFLNQALGFRDQSIEVRLTTHGLSVSTAPADAQEAASSLAGSLTFALPDRVTVAFSMGRQAINRIVMHLVPTGPTSCRQEWLVSTGAADPSQGSKVVWIDEVNAIFEQDRELLESIQQARSSEGDAIELSVEADIPTLLARRVYALACSGRWETERHHLSHARVVRIRT
jgi:phenylpropionate dioxygenase-like ring-hydroxylating dioxygenase large terminal subunit